jgi:hypothetical protein
MRSGGVVRSLCLSVDIQGYGARNDHRQAQVQVELIYLLDGAARAADLNRDLWIKQAQGDGELSLIPADQPETRVLDGFVRELATLLYRRNCEPPDGERLRLRLALDYGPVQIAVDGVSGRGVVAVSRLVTSQPVRQALAAAPDASLAAIVSQRVYVDLVLGGHTSVQPAAFGKVAVHEKEFVEDAWLWVPGTNVHQLSIPSMTGQPGVYAGTSSSPDGGAAAPTTSTVGAPQPGPDPSRSPAVPGDVRPRPEPAVVNVLHGPVDAREATFGIRNG